MGTQKAFFDESIETNWFREIKTKKISHRMWQQIQAYNSLSVTNWHGIGINGLFITSNQMANIK